MRAAQPVAGRSEVSEVTEHILVVDDDDHIRDLLATVLAGEGYRVATATNGREALQHIVENKPRLVLLDLQMPLMTGQELLAELRAAETGVPVVFMSAGYRVRAEAARLGADGYLAKPFDLDAVFAAVARIVG
jgi:DNA-binding response OmpR family regulator